ncbi:hypothetical protein BACFIN_05176 [Bacteroides finegoldii DSM 17565]|nr:hypothetical protein BACFIN_05176 [Bacteroides finegoldii DSM 17565]
MAIQFRALFRYERVPFFNTRKLLLTLTNYRKGITTSANNS